MSANLSGLTQRAALGRHPTHTPLPPWWLVPGSVCGDLRLPHPRVWTVAVPARRHGHQWGVRKPRAAPGGDRWRAGWPFSPPHVPQSQEPGGRPRLCPRCRREHGGHRPPRRLLCSRVLRGPSPSQSDRRGRDLWNSLRTATSRGGRPGWAHTLRGFGLRWVRTAPRAPSPTAVPGLRAAGRVAGGGIVRLPPASLPLPSHVRSRGHGFPVAAAPGRVLGVPAGPPYPRPGRHLRAETARVTQGGVLV